MIMTQLLCRALYRYGFASFLFVFSLPSYAFTCSVYEGLKGNIPSYTSEIAELRNMDKNGRHIRLLVPKKGAIEEFDLEQYLSKAQTKPEVLERLEAVEGAHIIYIDLYEVQKRYEIRIGTLTTNISRVIKQTVYANFAYNLEHNEVYDLQNNLAVFCN